MSEIYDVVIVGGGPAGSATAARLAGAGHRVLVLDRAIFPRPKPCGECLSPAAVAAVDSLGALSRVLSAPHAPIDGWRIQPEAGPAFTGSFPRGASGLAIARASFDAILLQFAQERGAVVHTGVRVGDLILEQGRVKGVRTGGRAAVEIRARLVIGADGLRSVVVRRLSLLGRQPKLRKVALTAHLTGIDDLRGKGELRLRAGGCLGIAAISSHEANVTLVVGGSEAERVARGREDYFDQALRGWGRLGSGVRQSEVLATGPFDWPTRAAVANGAMLVGDAAGYYDPFTGQGIYRALRGAELAASAADAALRADDLSATALWPYELARRREFSPGVRLQHAIEFFTSRPGLMKMVGSRLATRPALADALVAVTGDTARVGTLLKPATLAALIW